MTLLAQPDTGERPASGRIIKVKWQTQQPPQHEFFAAICPEEEGGYSVFAVHIPGLVSQGESLEEAKLNITEAFLAMLEACRVRGEPLPYSSRPVVDLTAACQRCWITLDG
jgi:predicted RNase H-like HicB family nuclease